MSSDEELDVLRVVNPSVATAAAAAASAATAANVSTQLLDLRGLAKPRTFEGKDADWDEWAFAFKAIAHCLA